MANHYTLFSEGIGRITPEERAWIERQLNSEDWIDGKPPEWDAPVEDRALGFAWSLDEGPPDGEAAEGEGYLWLYAEGSGDHEEVARFVRAFLARFRLRDHFMLTYANVCSNPGIGEFSGGAVIVSGDGFWHTNAYDWLSIKPGPKP